MFYSSASAKMFPSNNSYLKTDISTFSFYIVQLPVHINTGHINLVLLYFEGKNRMSLLQSFSECNETFQWAPRSLFQRGEHDL